MVSRYSVSTHVMLLIYSTALQYVLQPSAFPELAQVSMRLFFANLSPVPRMINYLQATLLLSKFCDTYEILHTPLPGDVYLRS